MNARATLLTGAGLAAAFLAGRASASPQSLLHPLARVSAVEA